MSECVDTGEPRMASHTAVGRRTATAERLRMPRPAQRQTPLVTVYIICVYSNLYAVVRRRPHAERNNDVNNYSRAEQGSINERQTDPASGEPHSDEVVCTFQRNTGRPEQR